MAHCLHLLLVLTNFVVNLLHFNDAIPDPALLFANRQEVRLVDIDRPWVNGTSLTKNIHDAAAVDFNFARREVCWIDIFLGEIKCSNLPGPSRVRPRRVITEWLINPDGLAIDWITGKLYWTDSDTKRIEVANRTGGNRRVLFYDRLDRPRAIALLPSEGLLFWTDWGEIPKIERAGMDGDLSTRSVFVRDDIHWPNGITIDYETKMVYWTEAKKERPQISAQRYDGTGRRVVMEGGELKHPFSVTLFRDRLYWTDWHTRSIHSCKKRNGGDVRTVLGGERGGRGVQPLDVHVFTASRQPAWHGPGPVPCAEHNGGCSHLCLLSPGAAFRPTGAAAGRALPGHSCSCPTGVRLINETHCADRPERLIILARRTDLRLISLDTPDHTDIMLPLKGVKQAVAVDYDPIEDQLYWTDEETQRIQRSRLDGTDQETVVVSELHNPDGVAVDWIARNIHWTDTGSNRIEVSRLDGTARKVLISEDLDEPRAIAVDPVAGYMYWSDWSDVRPKIERSALDGSRRHILFDTDLKWPNGIALDFRLRTLYWCDAGKDRIETANMDGSGRRVVLNNKLPHLFGISLLDNFVYWTDWTSRTIERAHKMTGDEREVIVEHLPDLMGLKVVSRTAPTGTNGCWQHNGNCSHLCLNTPDGPSCYCPIGHELTSDLKTCIVPEAFLLYSQSKSIRRISLETPQNDVIIPLSGISDAGFLDFNMRDERIYWTDMKNKSISRAFTNGSGLQKIIQLDTEFPEGMAVDWLAGNIYWSEALGRIEVARVDGSSRRVLLWDNSRSPRSIAVDASAGYLFWADWSAVSSLYRSRLDCTATEQFVTAVNRCDGLTVDHDSGRLFWVDIDSRRIESVQLTGDGRRVVLAGLKQPYTLAVYGKHVYWSDWTDDRIERADKMTGDNRTVVRDGVKYVVSLLVFHRSQLAAWTPCVEHNGGCQSLCFASPLTADGQRPPHRCGCRSHYQLAADGRRCLPPAEFLLFAQRSRVHRYMTLPGEAPDITLPITHLRNPRALSFDPRNQHLYWADAKTETIRRARDDNTAQVILVHSSSNAVRHRPFDIQVEPYSGVLFWSCAEQNTINVTRLNGSQVGVVVGGPDSADRPRHLALMAEHGLMVWANQGPPARIELCRLDGSQRRPLVADLERPPSALTADPDTQLVYWADLQKVWVTDLNGSARVLVDRSQQKVEGAVRGLAVLGPHLYWVDPKQQLIERVDKHTGEQLSTVVSRTEGLTAIAAVANRTRQMIVSHPCYGNGLCSHLCVAVSGRPLCSCPLGLELGRDNRTCQRPPSCAHHEFACPYGEPHCVPLRWRCDGKPECEGGADEHNCSACTGAQFACNNGQCIERGLACDGVPQCDDRSDETACCGAEPNQFFCHRSQQCVPLRQLCDGVHHCQLGEDELTAVCAGGVSGVPADSLGGRAGRSQHSLLVILAVFAVTALAVSAFVLWWCRCRSGKAEPIEAAAGGGPMAPAAGPSVRPRPAGASRRSGRPRRESVQLSVLSRPGAPASSPVSSAPYDRAHVTGASSSSSGSAGTRYPLEPLNPPPSPATGLHSAAASTAAAGSSHAPTLGSYRYYKLRNRPPPPTPCSTDVCDSDSATYYAYRCGSALDSDYESDTYGVALPPPPPPPPPSVAAKRPGGSRHRDHRDRPGPPPPSPAAERYML
ncbi:low-density lipoprotein receptor-related protein 5-like [Amphibalanus amphitrite]|uniref:low-density lipoprotein receptor-related protein 5-like n=1 Tax=Amphibalanus amphitrite TaxID=1232801 RepID=UPI001C9252A7|nr:low-density lipoprotein receptor-related protein 5-like [Amphibalanus amphitrite]